jgi:ABC-type phosphate transport system ATPase subunit
LIRKSQCNFGWDWGPRYLTCGIFRPIELHAWSGNRFRHVHVAQEHIDDTVMVRLSPELAAKDPQASYRLRVRLGEKLVAECDGLQALIASPQLWWPNGHGEQPLYTVELELQRDGQILDRWQRRIGYVAQDVATIDDTIRGNVALGWDDDEIDDHMVTTALDLAHLAEVVAQLPDGVNTLVGERGVRLSGGQRQRLGLARALYTNPDVLVLDEATSHLDTFTERSIKESIAQLHGRLTIIMVAHRLETVRGCDRVIVLDAGRVVASGTPGDVLSGMRARRSGEASRGVPS